MNNWGPSTKLQYFFVETRLIFLIKNQPERCRYISELDCKLGDSITSALERRRQKAISEKSPYSCYVLHSMVYNIGSGK